MTASRDNAAAPSGRVAAASGSVAVVAVYVTAFIITYASKSSFVADCVAGAVCGAVAGAACLAGLAAGAAAEAARAGDVRSARIAFSRALRLLPHPGQTARFLAYGLMRGAVRLRRARAVERPSARPAAGLLAAATWLLPAASRARYLEELTAELHELAAAGAGLAQQSGYALRQLLAAPRTSLALRLRSRQRAAP